MNKAGSGTVATDHMKNIDLVHQFQSTNVVSTPWKMTKSIGVKIFGHRDQYHIVFNGIIHQTERKLSLVMTEQKTSQRNNNKYILIII